MFKCFFGHYWHNVSSVIIEANGNISRSKDLYSSLGEVRHSNRICEKCDKVEFNKDLALTHREERLTKSKRLAKRLNNYRKMKKKTE